MSSLNELATDCYKDSQRWFPALHDEEWKATVHFALGIAGEVGELVNIIKKINRGTTTVEQMHTELGHEVADCIIYLLDLAMSLNIDVEAALADKRAVLVRRWG